MLIGREKEKQVGLTELTVNSCFSVLSPLIYQKSTTLTPLKNDVSVVNFCVFTCVSREKVVYLHPT